MWLPSPTCPSCLGLPEEMRIRRAGLQHGLIVVAVTSADRRSGCWDAKLNAGESGDGTAVAAILGEVAGREGVTGMPVYALGASSGGAFVLMLPHLVQVKVGVWGCRGGRSGDDSAAVVVIQAHAFQLHDLPM